MSTIAPTRQECIDAAAEVILAAAIRIETERRDAWLALSASRRKQITRTVYGCWIPMRRTQPEARRLCDEPRCIYPQHLADRDERRAA